MTVEEAYMTVEEAYMMVEEAYMTVEEGYMTVEEGYMTNKLLSQPRRQRPLIILANVFITKLFFNQ